MALLVVQQPNTRICMQGEALVVRQRRLAISTTPIQRIDEVHLYGPVEVTAPARRALLRARIEVAYFTRRGHFLGRLEPRRARSGARRVAQLERLKADAVPWARYVLTAKLDNQRRLLLRTIRNHPAPAVQRASIALARLIERLEECDSLNALRGVEGQAAAMYFRALAGAIRDDRFEFPRRSRRPPRDAFNACLSFSYTLWQYRVDSAVRAAGLDPMIGALHASDNAKPAMVLDVLEPLRPIIDRVVLRLVNRRQLDPADFEQIGVGKAFETAPADAGAAPADTPGVHVGPRMRPIVLRALAAAWRAPIRMGDQSGTLDQAIGRWLGGVGRWCEGAAELPSIPRLGR